MARARAATARLDAKQVVEQCDHEVVMEILAVASGADNEGHHQVSRWGVPAACNRVWRSTALRGHVSTKDTKEVRGNRTEHLPLHLPRRVSVSLCDSVG